MVRIFRSVLYSVIVTILAGFIFASATPLLDIRAETSPLVSARLLGEFYSTNHNLKRVPPKAKPDTTKLSDFELNIAVTVTVTNVATGLLPNSYSLSQNYPNPFNASTIINYTLPEPVWVTLEVYNILGQRVTTLVDEYKFAGEHSVHWDANFVASGFYFYRIRAGNFQKSRKMVLVK